MVKKGIHGAKRASMDDNSPAQSACLELTDTFPAEG